MHIHFSTNCFICKVTSTTFLFREVEQLASGYISLLISLAIVYAWTSLQSDDYCNNEPVSMVVSTSL